MNSLLILFSVLYISQSYHANTYLCNLKPLSLLYHGVLLFCFMPTECMNNNKWIELLKGQLKTRQINVVKNVATDSEYFGIILKIKNLSLL